MFNYVPANQNMLTQLLLLINLTKLALDLHLMLVEAYAEHGLGRTQCYEWLNKLKNGDFDVRNKERGKPLK